MADDVQVIFGADISGLVNGADEIKNKIADLASAIQKGFATGVEEAEGLAAAFGPVGEAVAAAVAVIQGANALLLEFGTSVAEMGAQIDRAAQSLGVSVQEFQQLQFAASVTDVSTQSLTFAMQRLAANMAAAERGSKTEADAFARLGVSLTDANGKTKDMQTVFEQTADSMAAHADGTEKTALAIQLLGRSGAQMIPVLDEGSQGLADLAKQAQATGSVFSDRLINAMDDTNVKSKVLDASITGLKGTLFDVLKPVIDQVITGFTNFVQSLTDGIGHAGAMQQALVYLVEAFEDLQKAIALVQQGFVMFYDIGQAVFVSLTQGFIATAASIQDAVNLNWGAIAGEWTSAGDKVGDSWVKALVGISGAADQVDISFKTADDSFSEFLDRLNGEQLQQALDRAAAAKAASMKGAPGSGSALPSYAPPADPAAISAQQRALQDVQKMWSGFFTNIVSGFDKAVSGLINGTMTWKQAFFSILNDLWKQFADIAEKMVVKWLSTQAMKLSISVQATAAETAAVAAGQAAQTGLIGAQLFKQIIASAQGVFAGIFSFLAPLLGPAAAGPATAGAATVAAAASAIPALATGTWNVPAQMLAMLHPGEIVVPAPFADGLRSMMGGVGGPLASGGAGSTPDVHFHIHAIDTKSGADFISRHAGDIAGAFASEARRLNSRLRRRS